MYTEIGQKGDTFHVSFAKVSHFRPCPHQSGLSFIVYSNLWNSTKKADRLLTYRLLVCFSLVFNSLYYSTDSLTMQCVFSPIKRLFSIYYTLLYSTILLTTQRILQSSTITAISSMQLFHI